LGEKKRKFQTSGKKGRKKRNHWRGADPSEKKKGKGDHYLDKKGGKDRPRKGGQEKACPPRLERERKGGEK